MSAKNISWILAKKLFFPLQKFPTDWEQVKDQKIDWWHHVRSINLLSCHFWFTSVFEIMGSIKGQALHNNLPLTISFPLWTPLYLSRRLISVEIMLLILELFSCFCFAIAVYKCWNCSQLHLEVVFDCLQSGCSVWQVGESQVKKINKKFWSQKRKNSLSLHVKWAFL